MRLKMLAVVISLIVLGCSSVPVAPVPLPLVAPPPVEELTNQERMQLSQCTEDKTYCAVHRSALLKIWAALFAYKQSFKEADAILRSTHDGPR